MAEAATSRSAPIPVAEIDFLLSAQLAVAWAGEGGEEARLGWWRSDLVSEYGGEDLFKRLLPHTWRWAVLQAAREAARRRDAECRAQYHDPDQIVSLFCLGFEVDERVDERLQDLKRSGAGPDEALPTLGQVITRHWDRAAFTTWLDGQGPSSFVADRLRGAAPPQLGELAGQLLAAL